MTKKEWGANFWFMVREELCKSSVCAVSVNVHYGTENPMHEVYKQKYKRDFYCKNSLRQPDSNIIA